MVLSKRLERRDFRAGQEGRPQQLTLAPAREDVLMWRLSARFRGGKCNACSRRARRAKRNEFPYPNLRAAVPRVEILEHRRLLAAGDIDTTFGNAGVVDTSFGSASSVVVALGLQTNGKVVAVGLAQGEGYAVARYNTDGSLDSSFGNGGTVIINSIGSASQVAIKPDGDIVVLGDRNGAANDTLVVELTTNGSFDTGFGTNGQETLNLGSGGGLAINPAGTVYVAGDQFGTYKVARLNSDGSIDPTFGNNGIASLPAQPFANSNLDDLAFEPDGKIVGGGTGGTSGTSPDFAVVRFNSDGTPDTSFGTGGVVQTTFRGNDEGHALAIQSDGKILLAGSSYRPSGAGYDLAMARYNSDGTLDSTFGTGGKVLDTIGANNSMIFDLLVEPNGKVVAAGEANGTGALFRFNSNGSFDSSFGNQGIVGDSLGQDRTVVEQPDGKFVIGGGLFSLERFLGETPDASLTPTATNIAATEGATFSGAVATFTDADPTGVASDFTATIDWGDESTLTTVSGSQITETSGLFSVPGEHVYAEEGTYTVTVTISDLGGAQATVTSSVNVTDAKLHLTAAAAVSPAGGNAGNVLLATFTDDGGNEPAGNYSATIDWGDGATTAGSIALSNGVFQIVGSHQYARAGSFEIGVSVSDDGGSMDVLAEATAVRMTPHQEYVIAVYHDVLDRAPDPGGLAYWAAKLDGGTLVSSVAQSIAHSNEYYAQFVIEPAYLKLLGRAADQASVTYWTQKMQKGLTDQQLEAGLAASDEFYARAGENYDPASDADDTTNADLDHDADWVAAVYKLLLGRTVDQGGEAHWGDQLNAGMSRGQVALSIANSAENNSQLISNDYQHYIGRPADSGGLTFWLSQFATGQTNEDVIAVFTGSAEYYREHTS